MSTDDDRPKSLGQPGVREQRIAMLGQPHMVPLVKFVDDLRRRWPAPNYVPDFDPLDGGVGARVLFLFEKPGPMTDPARAGRAGSGFISRNNADLSAEATFKFMAQAGIERRDTVIWNVIPWWDGHIKFTQTELRSALVELDALIALLPRLEAVVLVGNAAAKAEPHLRSTRPCLKIIQSAHPSPKVRATNRPLWDEIPAKWREGAGKASIIGP
jgi:uracil-DNA glycosylase